MAEIVLDLGTGFNGECAIDGANYNQKISCTNFSLNCTQEMDQTTQNTRTVHTVVVEAITLGRNVDQASVKLIDGLVSAKSVATGYIRFLKGAGTDGTAQVEYLTITLTDVLIASHNMTIDEGSQGTEEITLTFSTIKWEYKIQQKDSTLVSGTVATNFNVLAGVKAKS
jgi:type VI secretion system Hcp family effector